MFDKSSSAYISNGHYHVDCEKIENGSFSCIEYMSIWTFKNKNNISPNSNDANRLDAEKIQSSYIPRHSYCIPDFGNFPSVKIFPVEDLKKHYKISNS
jgi:hypothetical protein